MAMFTLGSATSSPITVELVLDNKRMPMEVNTGTAVSIMSADTLRVHFPDTRLPFGIASAPAIFQKTMNMILQGMNGVICYIDDILIMGKMTDKHLANLEAVLEKLREHGVRVKREKCEFLQPSVEYLGHKIDAKGLHA